MFIDKFKDGLGARPEDILIQDNENISKLRRPLKDPELLCKAKKREVQYLRIKIERVQDQIDTLEEEHGSNVDSELELRRLQILIQNYLGNVKKNGCHSKNSKTENTRNSKIGSTHCSV